MAQKNIIKRIISSPLVQTFLIYVSGGWIALEMTDYIIDKYGLNDKISDVLPIILLIVLPIAIFLAWYLSRDKEVSKEKAGDIAGNKKSKGIWKLLKKKQWFFIPVAVVIIMLLVSAGRFIHRKSMIKWAREKAVTEIENSMFNGNKIAALNIVNKALKYIPDDKKIKDLDTLFTTKVTVLTDPPGAKVYIREYKDKDGEWELLGNSPIPGLKMPIRTIYECKITKEQFEPISAVWSTTEDTLYRKLFSEGSLPEGMVHVIGYRYGSASNYLGEKNDFFIDRYEVTNRQYKKFVDNHGYINPDYWKHDFILEDNVISWAKAMDLLKDKTGRPGPATWEASNYPKGQEEYPVNGISWYEAAAFAKYAEKDLPTLRHWYSAAGIYVDYIYKSFGQHLIPLSNMKDNGPVPVGFYGGVGCFGNFDMAGNVREWCYNKTQNGRTVIGGAWNDVSYMYTTLSQAPPFDRSPKNGFRCAKYFEKEKIPESAFQSFGGGSGGRDFYQEKPVSEEVFKVYKSQFLYDKAELNSVIEQWDEDALYWVKEKITFDAAYEGERMVAYLFLPKEGKPPYQTIIVFSGSYAHQLDSLPDYMVRGFSGFLLNNNIAVMWPIYKGTFDRYEEEADDTPIESHTYTDWLIKWGKDFSRSIDYLETRSDINSEKIGFFGHSWGGYLGGIIPAVEERIKISILDLGGLYSWTKAYPEADIINYITRVKCPVLMLNGKYDFIFPYEIDVKPMYDLLGTPENDKVLIMYETDHSIPRTGLIKETLNFMEKYFGPSMN